MVALQRVGSSVSTAGSSSYASCMGPDAAAVPEQFPVGLRVLVVDDDVICLKIVERMLQRCLYSVTTCSQATDALNLLRERKGSFDIVLSDVHMPDMDGYKLLEHVGLEMDLPVIMMSADTRTSAVMKGVRHGACDYLIKPIREEELKNIWQHVLRKRRTENKEHDEYSGSLEDNDRNKRGSDELENASSVNEAPGVMRSQKKRSNTKDEDDVDQETDDPSTSKKPRVVWSVELHQQFVTAVNQLGIDKAVPKRILELMNVPGLTRENVASHLQKFRLYLKRLSGVAQQNGISNAFCGPLESGVKLNPLGRFDIQALAASGQIPPQTLAALHAELFGRPANGLVSAADQANLLQASLQSAKCISIEQGMGYGQPLKCQSNLSKRVSQNAVSMEEMATGFGAWPSATVGAIGPSSNCGVNLQNGNTLIDMVLRQQQHQQPQPKQQQQLLQQSSVMEASRSINVQPSCLIVPSHSGSFQAGNSPAPVNQSYNRSVILDYSLLSQSDNSLDVGTLPNKDVNAQAPISRYPGPSSLSPAMSSNFVNGETSNRPIQSSTMTYKASRQMSGHAPSFSNMHATYSAKAGELVDQGMLKSLGFVGKGTCIPSRFAVDDLESQGANLAHGLMYPEKRVNKVKQEPDTDVLEGTRAGFPIFQQFSPNDLMSVFTE